MCLIANQVCITPELIQKIESLENISPIGIQHALSYTFKFDSDAVYSALSSAMFQEVKKLQEWDNFKNKTDAKANSPYYQRKTRTPEFKFEWMGLIIGYSCSWSGNKNDLESKRLMWIKSKKTDQGYKLVPDKLFIKVYPDWENDRGISINVHIGNNLTTFQVWPKSGALRHDSVKTKEIFYNFISKLKIGTREIDLSRIQEYISFTEKYVRVNRLKTPVLMGALDSFFYTLSCYSDKSISISSNIMRNYNRDKFISLFRGNMPLKEINQILDTDIGNSISLKVYFPKDYRSMRKDQLGYHPKVEVKIMMNHETDTYRALRFYQTFLSFFLMCSEIYSKDLIIQDQEYFDENMAYLYDSFVDLLHNTIDQDNTKIKDLMPEYISWGLVDPETFRATSSLFDFLEFFNRDLCSDIRISHFSYELPDLVKDSELFKELRRKQDILNDMVKYNLTKSEKYDAVKSEIRALNDSLRKISTGLFTHTRLHIIMEVANSKYLDYYSLMESTNLSRATIYYHTRILMRFGILDMGELTESSSDEKGNIFGYIKRTFSINPEYGSYFNDLDYYTIAPKILDLIRNMFFLYSKHFPELLPFTNDELRWWEKEVTDEKLIAQIDLYTRKVDRLRAKLDERLRNRDG